MYICHVIFPYDRRLSPSVSMDSSVALATLAKLPNGNMSAIKRDFGTTGMESMRKYDICYVYTHIVYGEASINLLDLYIIYVGNMVLKFNRFIDIM